jgi:hypothetical protein
MSNIELGTEIYSDGKSFKLLYHADGHVRGWNRDYFDGQALPTWQACDHGTVDHAVQVYPGLREEITNVAKRGQ